MDRNSHFVTGAISARTHPHFFKPPVGAPRRFEVDDNVTIRHKGKDLTPEQYAAATKPKEKPFKSTSKVIKPGTIV